MVINPITLTSPYNEHHGNPEKAEGLPCHSRKKPRGKNQDIALGQYLDSFPSAFSVKAIYSVYSVTLTIYGKKNEGLLCHLRKKPRGKNISVVGTL